MKKIKISVMEGCDLSDILTMIKGLPLSVKQVIVELHECPDTTWMDVHSFQEYLDRWCKDLMQVTFRLEYLGKYKFSCDNLEDGMEMSLQDLEDWRAERGE